jgi:hypothetical protein
MRSLSPHFSLTIYKKSAKSFITSLLCFFTSTHKAVIDSNMFYLYFLLFLKYIAIRFFVSSSPHSDEYYNFSFFYILGKCCVNSFIFYLPNSSKYFNFISTRILLKHVKHELSTYHNNFSSEYRTFLLLYCHNNKNIQFARRMIKLTVIITVTNQCYQLHITFYPVLFSQG